MPTAENYSVTKSRWKLVLAIVLLIGFFVTVLPLCILFLCKRYCKKKEVIKETVTFKTPVPVQVTPVPAPELEVSVKPVVKLPDI